MNPLEAPVINAKRPEMLLSAMTECTTISELASLPKLDENMTPGLFVGGILSRLSRAVGMGER